MRDYWLTKDLLQATGIAFIFLSAIGLVLALVLPRKWWAKLLAVIAVGVVIAVPLREVKREGQQMQVAVDDYKARYTRAKALFDERCKTAGERIYRTAEGVEGVLLLNVRDPHVSENRANPLWPDAGLPQEAGGDDYIRHFLYWEHKSGGAGRGFLNPDPRQAIAPGYRFVDVKQPDATMGRYRLAQASNPDSSELRSEPLAGKPARYAVGFVNRVDSEDRRHWVAGTTITITDTQTNEVMAQMESHALEPGLGNTSGFRSPWGFAVTCPSWIGWDGARTRFFVDRVLKPMQGR